MKPQILLSLLFLLLPLSSSAQSPGHPSALPVNSGQPAAARAANILSYAIAGTVVDAATANPIPRAELTLQFNGGESQTAADSSGKFLFDHLEPGKYQLFARSPGYSAQGLNQHGSFFTGVVVGDALDSEHVLFRLHPQAVIFGKVTDERGEAVRNASVQIVSQTGNSPERTLSSQMQTNDLGEYRFAGLLPGKYFVAVSAQPWYAQIGFRFLPEVSGNTQVAFGGLGRANTKFDPALDVVYPLTFYPGVTDDRSAAELNVHEGETMQADIPLRAVPAVHLRLTNLPPDPAALPHIGAIQHALGALNIGVPLQFGQISPGEVEIAGLPPGEMSFSLHSPDGSPHNARQLEVNVSGEATVDASRTLPSAALSGRILIPPGSGEFGDSSLLVLRENQQAAFAPVKKDGTFSFATLPSGTYSLLINLPGQAMYVQKISATGAKVTGRSLVITGTTDVQLTVVMGIGVGQISGIAVLNSHAADGILVLLLPDSAGDIDSDLRMDQSDSDGSFFLPNIVPGKYRLLAIQDGWDLDYRSPAVIKPYLAKAQSLQIAPNDRKKLTVQVQPLIK